MVTRVTFDDPPDNTNDTTEDGEKKAVKPAFQLSFGSSNDGNSVIGGDDDDDGGATNSTTKPKKKKPKGKIGIPKSTFDNIEGAIHVFISDRS